MTNYHVYLRGHIYGFGPSKGKLKLRVARRSGDLKKIAEVMTTLLGAKGIRTYVLHLEEEQIFGNMKRKLDVLVGDT